MQSYMYQAVSRCSLINMSRITTRKTGYAFTPGVTGGLPNHIIRGLMHFTPGYVLYGFKAA